MSTEVVKRDVDVTAEAVALVDEAKVLRTLGINMADPRAQATVMIAQKYNLDPLLKHVQLIEQGPYITRDGYLHLAHASGVFDGMEVIEEHETETHCIAKVSVYRKDMNRPFTATGRYPKKGGNSKADPVDMALTRAERRALKRAFDVAIPGVVDAGDDTFDAPIYDEAATRSSAQPVIPPPDEKVAIEAPQVQAEAIDTETTQGKTPAKSKPQTTKTGQVLPPPFDEPIETTTNESDAQTRPDRKEQSYKGIEGANPEPFPDESPIDPKDAEAKVREKFGLPAHEDETGEIADEVSVARLRKLIDQLDEEQRGQGGLQQEWRKAGLGSIKEGAVKMPLSQVQQAELLIKAQLVKQKDVYNARRKHVLALLSEISVTSDEGRHELISKATGGESSSSKALLGRHVKQINDYVDAIKAEERGEQ